MTDNREIILAILLEILEKGQYSHLVMKQVLDKYEYLPKQERAFIQRITEGTVERRIQLDYVIDSFSKTKTQKMKPVIRNILRMAVYQILFMDNVPDSATCNEAVKLAVKKGFASLKGFVNGVLRTIAREKETITYPDREKDPAAFLSVYYSMPEWIVKMWISEYGEADTEKILQGMLGRRPLTVRFEERINGEHKEELLKAMEAAGIQAVQSEELEYAYFLDHVDSMKGLPGFQEGEIYIQDIGSMLVTELANVQEGSSVIDVCGAPGGKALHIASKMKGTGHVLVRDLTEYKVGLIQENMERNQIKNCTAQVWDATVLDETLRETADLVIADLPCSGLGVIGRKSDIKYRITREDVEKISSLQRQILQMVSEYVKKGGTLVYSTCTITREENQENAEWFAAHFPFTLQEERSMLPGIQESDGFYMARFVRNEE